MTPLLPLLLIAATVTAFAAGVHFGHRHGTRRLNLDDLCDLSGDDDMPRSIDGEAIDFRNAQTYDRERDGL